MIWDTAKPELLCKWKSWWMERHPYDIGDYSWSFLFERGKQIRAHLFCELWNYLCPDKPPCIEIAFMIECVHVTSLILDDLPWIDNASERRGWQTLHSKFSIRKALLLAHDVLELAYEVGKSQSTVPIDEQSPHSIWYKWCQTKATILWHGQWLDLSRNGSLEELAQMKTGILFECVTELVALFLGLDSHFWREWGKTIGILFQWIDDWNDRDEDLFIKQRNAFNESYDWTITRYTELWSKVVQGIGREWWNRSFGIYLWNYFTALYSIPPSIPFLYSLTDLPYLFVPSSLPPSPSLTFSDSLDDTSHRGLLFMRLFIPYLNATSMPYDKEVVDWSLLELWEKDESEWMIWLEKKEEILPFLKPLRHLESMIQSATKP